LTNIVLVGSTDRQLEDGLRQCGMTASPAPGSELSVLAQPSSKQPDVLVLDLREQTHLPTALPVLKRTHPTTAVILVASRMDPALLLEAMRAGVTEVVATTTQEDLQAAIARVMALRPAATLGGRAFAFLGAKGGVGTTTVAVNVATALAKIEPKSTLLIDLHVANGDAAVYLGAEPRFSIVDALENTHRLDESFFKTVVMKTQAGVDLLASSDRVMLTPVDVRRIRTILEFAERHYRYIVIDVPRSDAAVLDALETVAKIVIVANQELATVRSASRIAAAMRQRYGKDKLCVVLSRVDRLAEIGQDDVERAVGASVKHTFPSDYRRALQALNKGMPITIENHNELAGSFVDFARSLAGIERAPKEKQGSRFSLFGGRKASGQESRS
jgi:pilus assembly protein CpaE